MFESAKGWIAYPRASLLGRSDGQLLPLGSVAG